MIKIVGWLFVVLLIGMGLWGLSYSGMYTKHVQELKTHTGQISEHITYGPFTPDGRKSNVYFSLSGEDFRYRLSLPKGMIEDDIDVLTKGVSVEMQYRDRSDNKREVWEIALVGHPPVVSVKESKEHRDDERIWFAIGFLLFGLLAAYVMITEVHIMKIVGWSLVGFCIYTGLLGLKGGDYQTKQILKLKPHTGQISTDIKYEYAVDANESGLPSDKKHKAIFSLSGEDFEYGLLLLPGMNDIDELTKGASVEMQYLDRPSNKRRVWEIALVGQPPIVSVKESKEHREDKTIWIIVGFFLFGGIGAYIMITKFS